MGNRNTYHACCVNTLLVTCGGYAISHAISSNFIVLNISLDFHHTFSYFFLAATKELYEWSGPSVIYQIAAEV